MENVDISSYVYQLKGLNKQYMGKFSFFSFFTNNIKKAKKWLNCSSFSQAEELSLGTEFVISWKWSSKIPFGLLQSRKIAEIWLKFWENLAPTQLSFFFTWRQCRTMPKKAGSNGQKWPENQKMAINNFLHTPVI